MKVHFLQHSDSDTPSMVLEWLKQRNHSASVTRLYNSEKLPEPQTFDFLIVLGGDMNVDQESKFPWLTMEKCFIERCLTMNKTTLGLCLGGQLIAEALGARVKPHKLWEVGWHPVNVVNHSAHTTQWPEVMEFLHWHGYTFDLPAGAIHVARSEGCENQAYSYGKNVFGTQFHPEVDPAWLDSALTPPHPQSGIFVQSPEQIRAQMSLIERNKPYLFSLLDSLADTV